MTWGELLLEGQERLKAAGIAEYSLDAWYLFEHVFGISRTQYFLCARDEVPGGGEKAAVSETGQEHCENCPVQPKTGTAENSTGRKLEEFKAAIARRAKREPLQHIIGTQEFMGLEFYVNQHVLIPRQDTETLVETVLAAHKEKDISILDMCTGSGCIAVSLAALGGYAHVEAADLSEEALTVACKNAEKILGSKNTVNFRQSDMFSALGAGEQFDIIVSNPPYIPSSVIEELEPEVRDFEPRKALDGTEDGLYFYRILASECGRFLKETGAVYFEIGYDQGEAVENLLSSYGFKDTRIIKDLTGKDRVVCGNWQADIRR